MQPDMNPACDDVERRVLFVDDDPNILEGLERMLFPHMNDWEFEFAPGASEALELLSDDPYDIIVSDMRMPEIDGAELLTEVAEKYPRTIRVVLSGHAEREAVMRAMMVAHQFIGKPSDPSVIVGVMERALRLRALIENPILQATVGRLDGLPSRPALYSKLVAILSDERGSVADIAALIEQDLGIATKILQLANNAFFSRGHTVSGLVQAIPRIGVSVVRDVVLSIEALRAFHSVPEADLDRLSTHSLLVAQLARKLATNSEEREHCFTAGLLHDVGELVLLQNFPEEVRQVRAKVAAGDVCPLEAEREAFGVTHAEIGAYLLTLWGLPYPVVESVAFHHEPHRATQCLDGIAVLHIAEAAAVRQDPNSHEAGANEAFLAECNLLDTYKLAQETLANLAEEG